MATSTGKTVALILLVAIIIYVGWRMTPLFIAPFGMFTGMVETLRSGARTIHIWPYKFHFSPLHFFPFALFILWIFVIVWVYRDAERRGMNGLLWALLVFIGNLIGLLIYLIVRTDVAPTSQVDQEPQTTQPCPNCQSPVDLNFAYCPHCGTRIQEVCPQCGKSVEEDWKVCPHCGKKLEAEK